MSTGANSSAANASVSPPAEREFTDTPSSLAPVWEVVVGYILIEAALWTGGDLRRAWSMAAGVWIISLIIYRRQSLSEDSASHQRLDRLLGEKSRCHKHGADAERTAQACVIA